mmetsp:Transcript_19842/g.43084  ORF Transcript_19842/g.43084 Transcript_19842/m.43084 type:complete len:194 (-) Transcript_19842:313-894(-)
MADWEMGEAEGCWGETGMGRGGCNWPQGVAEEGFGVGAPELRPSNPMKGSSAPSSPVPALDRRLERLFSDLSRAEEPPPPPPAEGVPVTSPGKAPLTAEVRSREEPEVGRSRLDWLLDRLGVAEVADGLPTELLPSLRSSASSWALIEAAWSQGVLPAAGLGALAVWLVDGLLPPEAWAAGGQPELEARKWVS